MRRGGSVLKFGHFLDFSTLKIFGFRLSCLLRFSFFLSFLFLSLYQCNFWAENII